MQNRIEITLNQDNDQEINVEKIIEYWLEMSENDFKTMLDFYQIKRFQWALFLGHLVLEKLIKATFVKIHHKYPPFLHDLLTLAHRCNLQIDENQKDMLDVITTFNINARYDDYKLAFYKQCTPEYTEIWIKNIKDLRQWIIETQLKS